MKSNVYFIIVVGLLLASCNKEKYLDAKPDMGLIVPNNLDDLQAILDNTWFMNGKEGQSYPGLSPQLGELACDEHFTGRSSFYTNIATWVKKCYTWSSEDPYEGNTITDWNDPYRSILYANLVLESLQTQENAISQSERGLQLKASALFYRAHMYYQLAQVFAKPYNEASSTTDPGIVLRQQADVNEKLKRASVQQTYSEIIQDLTWAAAHLPIQPLYKTRPSRQAALGLLARTHLTMGNYDRALAYTDSCLTLSPSLIDYNTLDSTSSHPFSPFNEEVIFSCTLSTGNTLFPLVDGMMAVDSILYLTYDNHDLRRAIYYMPFTDATAKGMAYKGSYDGSPLYFSGVARDEMYLIRAECRARMGQTGPALDDLNTLLATRFKTGHFVPITLDNADQVLEQVLAERRKELVFRGLRWVDLRRLNTDPRFTKTLVREVEGQHYELPPNDPRYVFPIPSDVIALNPEMPQNER